MATIDSRPRITYLPIVIKALVVLALCVSVTVLLLWFHEPLRGLGRWGYLGAYIGQFIDSAVFLLPTPAPAITFSLARELNPWLLGVVGGLGASTGSIVGYLAGNSTRATLRQMPLYARVRLMMRRWGGPMIFAIALVPFPIDLAGMWAGAMHYTLPRYLLWVTPAKIIKVTAYCLAGAYGTRWLFKVFGIG